MPRQRQELPQEFRWSPVGLVPRPDLLAIAEANQAKPKTSSWEDRYLSLVRSGTGHYAACRQLNVKPSMVKKRIEMDPDFAESVEEAEETRLEELEQIYIDQGLAGDAKVLADILTKRYNRRWAERPQKIELTGNVTQNIDAMPILEGIGTLYKVLEERARLREGESMLELTAIEDEESQN